MFLTQPLIDEAEGERIVQFSNPGLAISLARSLGNLGFELDIVNWDDSDFVPSRSYDLVIVHGAKSSPKIYRSDVNRCVIYFSTGSYWKFHNQAEDKRLQALKRRMGVALPRDRYIYESEELVNRAADGIISIGNVATAATYKQFAVVRNLEIAVFPASKRPKDVFAGRQNFLFFSGGGNVHKGLDLALEAFDGSPHQLFICTKLDSEFKELYHELLFNRPNIHYIGMVGPRSAEFYELTDKCSFALSLSCSEGSPGSIVECMQQGLIPIVTQGSHIDVEGYGVNLADDEITTLHEQCDQAANWDKRELERRSEASRQVVTSQYTVERFVRELGEHILDIYNSASVR